MIQTGETMVFVPALMSAGLLFSIITIVNDALRWGRGRARHRRTVIEAHAIANELEGVQRPPPSETGVLSRPIYLVSATIFVVGAAYISIGSTANFLRDGGYVEDIGWLFAVSMALAALSGFLGCVCVIVFLYWPHPPAWTVSVVRSAPLSTTPGVTAAGPSWALSASLLAAAVATGLVALIVGTQRGPVYALDEPISAWLIEIEWFHRLALIDPFGSSILTLGFVLLVGLSSFRCRLMAIVYPVAFVCAWSLTEVLQHTVGRARPYGVGELESFPSGHLVQASLLAALVPYAIDVFLADRRLVTISRFVLTSGVIATALFRLHRGDHWPLDVLGGLLVGLTVSLFAYWILAHERWHRHCRSCPSSDHPMRSPWTQGVFELDARRARQTRIAGVVLAIGAAVALIVGTLFIGLPTDPEGAGLASSIIGPVQLGFAVLIAFAGLIALKWPSFAAFLMVLGATTLGLAASVQYPPVIAGSLSMMLLIPAVLTWLAWQPTETVGRIAMLAVFTVGSLTITAIGSQEIYGHYFGPSHPESVAPGLDSAADWLWLGAVTERSATIVAGGIEPGARATVTYWPDVDRRIEQVDGRADGDGVVRFALTDLEPATSYNYAVQGVDGNQNLERPDARFTTNQEGPHDLVVVVGSCTRTGSNGSVFDAILSEEPDLYLAVGDLHYESLASSNSSDHVEAFARAVGQPAQAQVFSSIPTAYVWDDHDFGPNDGDSTSPSRLAVSTAYRQVVPHHGVDPDPFASIAQAFTVGRVRFVLTDTRSNRTSTSMLGDAQLDWLIEELTIESKEHALVVWANPTPWISSEGPGSDNWSAYVDERRTISDALVAADVENVVMVSGDAHMVALDDGTNSGYSSDGSPGFPLLHAGALDRPGSVKGGPYSLGTFPGGGQYAKVEISDDGGDTIDVSLSGHTWDGQELLEWSSTVRVPQLPEI